MEHETFFSLLRSVPHWEFELFLMLLVDGVLGAFLVPLFKRWVSHHKSDDEKLADLQEQVKAIQDHLSIKS